MSTDSAVWVVVAAFNEGRAIASVLAELAGLPYRIVVVDDGSTDSTARVATAFPVTILRHECNLGQGAALQTGIRYALGLPDTSFLVTFDSDGQHSADDVPRLLEPLLAGTHDVVLGSRFVAGGHALGITGAKRAFLRLAVVFTRLTTGMKLTDTHNGLRAFTAEAAASMAITQNRMAHGSEIVAQIAALRLRWCEVPVSVSYTTYSQMKGQSMFNGMNILWDMVRGRMR